MADPGMATHAEKAKDRDHITDSGVSAWMIDGRVYLIL